MTTEEDCVRSLRVASNRLGHSPSKAEYEELGIQPASATIIRVIGGWNEAKARAGLLTNTSTGSRTLPEPEDIELPEDTRWEDLSVDQRWHYRNVERNSQRTLDRRAELRAWVYDLKSRTGGCSRCNESDPACLEYHHIEVEQKTMSISEFIQYEPSEDRLREEIEKCELLCANCHRKEHYVVPNHPSGSQN